MHLSRYPVSDATYQQDSSGMTELDQDAQKQLGEHITEYQDDYTVTPQLASVDTVQYRVASNPPGGWDYTITTPRNSNLDTVLSSLARR